MTLIAVVKQLFSHLLIVQFDLRAPCSVFLWCRNWSLTLKMPSISWICQRASMLEPITLFLRLFFCSLCYLSWIKVFLGFDMHSTITLRTCPFSNFVHFPMLVGRLFFMIQSIRKLMLLEAEQKCKYMSLELSRLTVQKLQYLTVI